MWVCDKGKATDEYFIEEGSIWVFSISQLFHQWEHGPYGLSKYELVVIEACVFEEGQESIRESIFIRFELFLQIHPNPFHDVDQCKYFVDILCSLHEFDDDLDPLMKGLMLCEGEDGL